MSDKPSSDRSDASFFERWSRLKRGQASSVPPSVEQAAGRDGGPDAGLAAVENLPATADVEALLPSIDELTAESDVSAFLQKGVSEELKRLALRRAWSLDPQISGFIEVAENQYDWNTPGGAPGFGDLAAGTKIEELLAQATGHSAPAAEPVSEDTTATSEVADVSVERAAGTDQSQIGSSGDAEQAAEPIVIQAEAPAGEPGLKNEDPPNGNLPFGGDFPPVRRRHGGALPG